MADRNGRKSEDAPVSNRASQDSSSSPSIGKNVMDGQDENDVEHETDTG